MNILGKKPDREDQANNKKYIPAVIRNADDEIPLGKSLIISALAHPLAVGLLWGIIKGLIILLAILGITLPIFQKPEPKIRDIEFILVNKPEQKPINPNTKYRADRNTRAGGKNDPKKAVSEPEPMSAQSKPQQPAQQRPVQRPRW